ncbi:unnamed protein product [Cylindrotheca closterium]|uniref:BRO1 domain-containing protein n=1 Tax=Cylindrotheca closterium TaxID=2856 RepID=A0AAD2FUB0_9STRA|nr:unnamed protein product [Cylindrotheca closterium]
MTLPEVVLPLRLTNPRHDLQGMLMEWMSLDARYDPRDCLPDLQLLSKLRFEMATCINEKNGHEQAWAAKPVLHQYYHGLLQCEKYKIGGLLDLAEKRSLTLEWESAIMVERQVGHSLEFEKVNLIWNLASMEAYQALGQPRDLNGYKAAARHFEVAASWLHQMNSSSSSSSSFSPNKPFPFLDFYPSLIRLWKGLLLAEAQHCAFQSHRCSFQPDHETLAEMAVAAVSMYSSLKALLQQKEDSSRTPILSQPLIQEWGRLIQGMLLYMKFMVTYHHAVDCRQKSLYSREALLLKVAGKEAKEFLQVYEKGDLSSSFGDLEATMRNSILEIEERIQQTSLQIEPEEAPPTSNASASAATITSVPVTTITNTDAAAKATGEEELEQALPKLTGSSQTYILPLERILQSYPKEPLFSSFANLQQSVARKQSAVGNNNKSKSDMNMSKQAMAFRSNMDSMLLELSMEVEEKRTETRQLLAQVKLPYSLTAYQQESQGGGIPPDLWHRVEAIQKDRLVELLKQGLWNLQDASESALRIHKQAKSQLDLDLENDRAFRMENPSFHGRNTKQLQLLYREQLSNYHRLLSAAREGDAVLIQRAELLDTNPKFKLLHFKKSQLNKLLPARKTCEAINVTQLSALILRLNRMFGEQDTMLHTLREDLHSFDIGIQLRKKTSVNHKRDCVYTSSYFEGPFRERMKGIRKHLDSEKPLLEEILEANKQFVQARHEQTSGKCSSADDCIAVLEEAIEELDQISNHLEEGKNFYSNITLKLETLRGQVDELSTKLTVERLEYDDREGRDRQEEADAIMAKRLSQDTPAAAAAAAAGVARGQLGWVDDEKVATLVAMDFDPANVVEALKNKNNDVDAALNELLSAG